MDSNASNVDKPVQCVHKKNRNRSFAVKNEINAKIIAYPQQIIENYQLWKK